MHGGRRVHGRRRAGRWRHALESRRVLALLLIAPAVIFMALVVGVPFVWAIYLSFTDAIGGSLTGNWVGFDNFTNAWHDDNFRRALRNTLIFTLASQAIVLVGAAVLSNFLVRDFRGKWIVRFLVVLPWAAPVVLSTIAWLWLLDSLYSVVNWTLATAAPRQRPRLVARRRAHRGGRAGAAAVARATEPRAGRDHDRARLADPPVRSRDLHRGTCVDPERGRGRNEDRRRDRDQEALVRRHPAAAPDRPRRGAVRDRLHRGRFRRRLHPDARRTVQLDAGAADMGLCDRYRLRLARRGRRDLALPLPAARRRHRGDAVLRPPGPGDVDDDRRQKLPTYAVVVPFAIFLAFPFYFALVTMFKTNLDLANVEHSPVRLQRRPGSTSTGTSGTTRPPSTSGSCSRTRTTRGGC